MLYPGFEPICFYFLFFKGFIIEIKRLRINFDQDIDLSTCGEKDYNVFLTFSPNLRFEKYYHDNFSYFQI